MYTRALKPLSHSFFLFGPRGTGKSTWIQNHYPSALTYDLLDNSLALKFSRDPSLLFKECSSLSPQSWIVIDEVQKVPELLDEVHRLIEQKKLNFVLSGSSARKLKRVGVNLLAGRAITQYLFPLTSQEVDFNFSVEDRIAYGMLPMSFTGRDPKPYLRSYVETYISEEIRAEALVRNIGNFSRFLEVAARHNGQAINTTNISRDAGVARQTVASYYDILVDTLVGFKLPAWKRKSSTRQRALSKFYLFDSGVARAVSGRLPYPPTEEEKGFLFETFIIQELRAYLSYTEKFYPLYYWGKQSGLEVDLLLETQDGFVAFELKSTTRWDKRFNRGLNAFKREISGEKLRCYGVYCGENKLEYEGIEVLPVVEFLQLVWGESLIR